MKKKIIYCLIAVAATAGIYSCSNTSEKEPVAMTPEQMVERGKYIVSTSGCNDCHTPKIFNEQGMSLDMSRMLSGHPADAQLAPFDSSMVGPWILFTPDLTACVGPWGTSYTANLTPSPSGLGNWTEDQFIYAIRNGKHMGMENQRPIMPPMPWQEVKNLTDEDLKSVFAFLKSIPPIDNMVPAFQPASHGM